MQGPSFSRRSTAIPCTVTGRRRLAEGLARRFLEDEPILARRIPPAERFARWVQHNQVLATAAMGFGVFCSP